MSAQKPRLFVPLSGPKSIKKQTLQGNDSNLLCACEGVQDFPESMQNDPNLSAIIILDRKVTLNSQIQLEDKAAHADNTEGETDRNKPVTPTSYSISSNPNRQTASAGQRTPKTAKAKLDTVLDLAQLLQHSPHFTRYLATKPVRLSGC